MESIVAGIVALLAIALAAFGIGRARGKAAGSREAEKARQQTLAAQRDAAGERVKAEAAQERQEVEREVEQLPAESAGDRLSAADRLRRDWSRD